MSGQRESNPLLKFRDLARLQRKLAAISALTALCENGGLARFAQNYTVRLSEIVRKRILSRGVSKKGPPMENDVRNHGVASTSQIALPDPGNTIAADTICACP